MARELVINGDDFGLTAGINRGVIEAYQRGLLTSASLFAHAPGTRAAIVMARRNPDLGIGCHLSAVDGVPLSLPGRVRSLVDDDGRFRPTLGRFLAACLAGRVSYDEVEREFALQIDRLRAAGLRITHLDGHKHLHLFPPVFERVARLARRFGIGVVRVPCERPAIRLCLMNAWRPRAARHALENLSVVHWAARARRVASAEGLRVPAVVGRVHSPLALDDLKRILGRLTAGVSELVVHPGYRDEQLERMRTAMVDGREAELNLLCSTAAHELIGRSGIKLVSHELTATQAESDRAQSG